MKPIANTRSGMESLRARAEASLRATTAFAGKSGNDECARLIYELRVHQAELKIQNDELHQAHRDLEQLRDRYFALYDLAPVPYFSLDRAGRIVEGNTAGAALLGVAHSDLAGLHLQRFMDAQSAEAFHRLRLRVLGSRTCHSAELTFQRADGAERFVRADVTSVQFAGSPPGMRCVLVDLTELRCAQRDLRTEQTEGRAAIARSSEGEQRFREIAETVEDVVYVRELDGRISYVNPALVDVWGVSAEDVKSGAIGLYDSVHEAERERVLEGHASMHRGDPLDHEFRIVRPDGQSRWVRERAFFVCDDGGKPLREVGVIQDVTVERDLQQELHHAQKMEALGALAGSVAHDFNNVLHVVLGFATMALRERDDERRQEHLHHIVAITRRGADLASRLMTFARKQGVTRKPLDLDAAVHEARKLLACLLTERVAVRLDLQATGIFVLGAPALLEQILMNLATNARDAMPEGGTFTIRTREVVLCADEAKQLGLAGEGRYARVSLRDTGIGMTEETRQRASDAFFTTKPAGRGTGLGLSTVARVVRELKGALRIESVVGRGTTVTFYLPVCAAPPRSSRGRARNSDARWHARALLVEDDSSVRATVRSFMEELGLDVVEASNPNEARRAFERHRDELHLIVTDVVMPVMTGPDFVAGLAAQLPTLFISALPEGSEGLPKLGCRQALLRKPFDRGALASSLDEILEAKLRAD